MEQKMPAPNPSGAGAYNPQVLPPQPEVFTRPAPAVEASSERQAQQEILAAGPVQAIPALPSPAPRPVMRSSTAVVPPLRPLTSADNNPSAAADEEVIEKEWVDKAKKIITQTKDDPYKQEREVSRLQADYLKKRYGKDIKVVEN